MLNPVFSIAHMRRMVPIFNTVCLQLQVALAARVQGAGEEGADLDVLAWTGRTALELIGQAGLGHSFDPLIADAPDEFAHVVKSFGYVLFPSTLISVHHPLIIGRRFITDPPSSLWTTTGGCSHTSPRSGHAGCNASSPRSYHTAVFGA